MLRSVPEVDAFKLGERRSEPRISTRLQGELRGRTGQCPRFCVIENISFGGAVVIVGTTAGDGSTLSLSIPQFNFTMPVRQVWRQSHHIGLAFDYYSDMIVDADTPADERWSIHC